MRKLLTILSLVMLTVSFAFANEKSDVFKYDEQKINAEFGKVNKLESYVNSHEGVTLSDVNASNAELTKGISLDANVSEALSKDLPGNIPAFWWGCVLSVLGVILVYVLTDNDTDQAKKALIGCLVQAGAYVLFYVVLYGLLIGGAAKWGI